MSSNFKVSELKYTLLMLSGSTLGLQNMGIAFSFKTISALKFSKVRLLILSLNFVV